MDPGIAALGGVYSIKQVEAPLLELGQKPNGAMGVEMVSVGVVKCLPSTLSYAEP